jgi:hypothetical protein
MKRGVNGMKEGRNKGGVKDDLNEEVSEAGGGVIESYTVTRGTNNGNWLLKILYILRIKKIICSYCKCSCFV